MKKLIALTTWLTQGLFVLAVCSGIPLLFFYHPTEAYNSVQRITYLIPYGSFVREFHYFSSEALLIVLFLHLIEQLILKEAKIHTVSWIAGTIAGICVILLLFSGFVIKGDQGGYSAGVVAISMIKNFPGVSFLTHLIESTSHFFYWKFFVWHAILLPAIAIILIAYHSGRIDAPLGIIVISTAITVLLVLTLKMPADIPPNVTVHEYINGPWFFEGIQKILEKGINDITVVISSILIPTILILIYPFTKFKKTIAVGFLLWLVWYVSVSLV